VEAHRAAIRQWLDKREQLGGGPPASGAMPRPSQVPVLPLRQPPVEGSRTFSSWSIAGYPGRTVGGQGIPHNANLGSARPPAMEVASNGLAALQAYRPVPGYGPDGLPIQRTPGGVLPPIPSIPPGGVSASSIPSPSPTGPTRSSQRKVLATV